MPIVESGSETPLGGGRAGLAQTAMVRCLSPLALSRYGTWLVCVTAIERVPSEAPPPFSWITTDAPTESCPVSMSNRPVFRQGLGQRLFDTLQEFSDGLQARHRRIAAPQRAAPVSRHASHPPESRATGCCSARCVLCGTDGVGRVGLCSHSLFANPQLARIACRSCRWR